jgi:hypothetical protein
MLLRNGKEGFDLNHDIILKSWRKFVKKAYHAPEFFIRGSVKHIPCAGFEPLSADPEGEGNEMDNPVVGPFMAAFEFGDIAVADTYGSGKPGLGESEGFPHLANPFIGGHGKSIAEKVSPDKGILLLNEY